MKMSNELSKLKKSYYGMYKSSKVLIVKATLKNLLGKGKVFGNIYNYLENTPIDEIIEKEVDELFETFSISIEEAEKDKLKKEVDNLILLKQRLLNMSMLEKHLSQQEEGDLEDLFKKI